MKKLLIQTEPFQGPFSVLFEESRPYFEKMQAEKLAREARFLKKYYQTHRLISKIKSKFEFVEKLSAHDNRRLKHLDLHVRSLDKILHPENYDFTDFDPMA